MPELEYYGDESSDIHHVKVAFWNEDRTCKRGFVLRFTEEALWNIPEGGTYPNIGIPGTDGGITKDGKVIAQQKWFTEKAPTKAGDVVQPVGVVISGPGAGSVVYIDPNGGLQPFFSEEEEDEKYVFQRDGTIRET